MRKLENQIPKLKINSSALAQDCYIRFLCHKNSRFNGRQDYIVRFALVRGNEYVCIMKKIKKTNIYWMLLVTWINKTTVNMKHRNLYHKKVTTFIVYSHSLAGCEKHLCYLSCHRMVNSRMVNFATLHEEKVIKKKRRNARGNKCARQHSAIWTWYLCNSLFTATHKCQEVFTKHFKRCITLSVRYD